MSKTSEVIKPDNSWRKRLSTAISSFFGEKQEENDSPTSPLKKNSFFTDNCNNLTKKQNNTNKSSFTKKQHSPTFLLNKDGPLNVDEMITDTTKEDNTKRSSISTSIGNSFATKTEDKKSFLEQKPLFSDSENTPYGSFITDNDKDSNEEIDYFDLNGKYTSSILLKDGIRLFNQNNENNKDSKEYKTAIKCLFGAFIIGETKASFHLFLHSGKHNDLFLKIAKFLNTEFPRQEELPINDDVEYKKLKLHYKNIKIDLLEKQEKEKVEQWCEFLSKKKIYNEFTYNDIVNALGKFENDTLIKTEYDIPSSHIIDTTGKESNWFCDCFSSLNCFK